MSGIQYGDPIIYNLRSGKSDDAYVFYTDSPYKVRNSLILLNELPVRPNKVQIKEASTLKNFSEIVMGLPSPLQYLVDYTTGIVKFNDSDEGKNIIVTFAGRGVTLLPSSRIWTKESNGDVVQTLQDIIDRGSAAIESLEAIDQAITNVEGAIEDAQAAIDIINNSAESIQSAESQRVTYESGRASAEASRVNAETSRATAESTRDYAESSRISAETTRTENESNRQNAETSRTDAEASRVTAEVDRVNAESIRESVESSRVTAEASRASSEETRSTQESTRIQSELDRNDAELQREEQESERRINEVSRVSIEATRNDSELERQAQEDIRQNQEDSRQAQEELRQSHESVRIAAETTRETNTTNAIDELNALKTSFAFNPDPYHPLATYIENNQVHYDGSTYICIQNSTGNLPTNPMYWRLFASKGERGEQGEQGVQGIQGIQGDKGVSWRGSYDNAINYSINDAVLFNGSSYRCIVPSAGQPPSNNVYWFPIAIKGIDGTGVGTVTSVTSSNDDLIVSDGTANPDIGINPALKSNWNNIGARMGTGIDSTIEGSGTDASGDYSHAQNLQSAANGFAQTVIGKYNVAQGSTNSANATDHAFIIGNGADDAHRSNAMHVTWEGNLAVAGTITDGTGASFATKADKNSPTFTGTTTLPADTSIGNVLPTEITYLGGVTSSIQSQLDSKQSTLSFTPENIANKGVANGYASLDSNAKIPTTQLPDSILGQVQYQGTWNASTNTPVLPQATTVKGYYYVVSTEGTYSGISFDIGDWVISNGSSWQKVDNTDAVPTVFGRTGHVVAASNDYTWAQINKATSSIADITTRNLSDLTQSASYRTVTDTQINNWDSKANQVDPAFLGAPTAPTPPVGNNSTLIATTAFVLGQAAATAPLIDGTAAVGTSTKFAREDHKHPTDTSRAPIASPSFTGTVSTSNNILDDGNGNAAFNGLIKLKGYTEITTVNGAAVGATSINLNNGNVHDMTLTGNISLTFANAAAAGQAHSFTLIIRMGATPWSIVWPTAVKWADATPPDLSTANRQYLLTFVTFNGGTTWYGMFGGSFA